MSTTFNVYPSNSHVPTFDEVLRLSNTYLKDMLDRHGITNAFQIDVQIRKKEPDTVAPIIKTDSATWSDDEYAWYVVTGQPGGCDAYYWNIEEPDDICDGMFSSEKERSKRDEPKFQSIKNDLKKCLDLGYYWHFRRSAGQPAIINLSYGIVAAAFAKATNGIIYSSDGAWDYTLFPVRTNEFLEQYFNPDCKDTSHAGWAKTCLEDIRTMFQ